MNEKAYIVVLNWNCWRDTIECIDSLFNMRGSEFHVVVCDNGSTDNSMQYIKQWAEGRLNIIQNKEGSVHEGVQSGDHKPVPYAEYHAKNLEFINNNIESAHSLTLIQTGANLGYAAGCNIGMRYSLAHKDCSHVWLLNNDTVVKNDSLSNLLKRMDEDIRIGICGSTLLYYDYPDVIQALGGAKYHKCMAKGAHVFAHKNYPADFDLHQVESQMSYVVGASMLLSRSILEKVGFLNEDYFLYCEEIDYCERAKGLFRLAYAPDSIVFHKEGASTGGTSLAKHKKSDIALYYAIRSKILFTRKFYPLCLPSVYFFIVLRVLVLILFRRFGQARMIIALLFGSEKYYHGRRYANY